VSAHSLAQRFMRRLTQSSGVAVVSSCEIMSKGFYSTLLETRRFNQVHLFKNESAVDKGFVERENISVVVIDADFFSCQQMVCFSVARISQYAGVSVIITSSGNDAAEVVEYMLSGAKAYIWRCAPLSCFIEAVDKVRRGGYWLESHIDQYYQKIVSLDTQRRLTVEEKAILLLTQAEHAVIFNYMNGLTVSEIAVQKKRSIKTISSHKQAAMKKLGVSNQMELLKRYGHLPKQ